MWRSCAAKCWIFDSHGENFWQWIRNKIPKIIKIVTKILEPVSIFMICTEWVSVLMLMTKSKSKARKIIEVNNRIASPHCAGMLLHSGGQWLAWSGGD